MLLLIIIVLLSGNPHNQFVHLRWITAKSSEHPITTRLKTFPIKNRSQICPGKKAIEVSILPRDTNTWLQWPWNHNIAGQYPASSFLLPGMQDMIILWSFLILFQFLLFFLRIFFYHFGLLGRPSDEALATLLQHWWSMIMGPVLSVRPQVLLLNVCCLCDFFQWWSCMHRCILCLICNPP